MTALGSDHLGEIIEGYRLTSVLGSGSASVVYRAERVGDPDTVVAIKLLTFHDGVSVGDRASFRKRFLREARSTTKLKHDHIVPVLSYGEEDGRTYIVMPIFTGGTLADQLEGGQRQLDLAEIASYLSQLASALDYTHERGIVHRDIKPSNVVMDHLGQVYLADFGIARLFDTSGGLLTQAQDAALTQTGQVLGTPYYMAPEQIRGEPVGPATDIYSLGVMLFQLVTGQLPYQGDNPLAVAMQHLQEAPIRPSLLRPDCPPALDEVILKAMARRPEDRYAHAGLLARDFELAVQPTLAAQDKTILANKADAPMSYAAMSGVPLYHDMVGTTLGSYRLEQLLAVTEMGPVFRAQSDVGSALYRLRALSAPTDADTPAETRSAFLGRIQQIAHTVAELHHPYILTLQDYGSARGMPYLVTNSALGPSLAERLAQTGPMDLNMVGRRLDQLAAALQYAHEHGVLHRNLTADCVYMQGTQDLVVADFEARRMYESLGVSAQHSPLLYSSESFTPEQIEGKPADTYTDVYALGVILYQMLTGHPLYTGATRDELADQHLHAPTPLLRRWRAGLPAGLENVLARALAKDPAQRYRHPAELAHAYHELVDGVASATSPAAVPGVSAAPGVSATASGPTVDAPLTGAVVAGGAALEPTQVAPRPLAAPPVSVAVATAPQEPVVAASAGEVAQASAPAARAVNLSGISGALRQNASTFTGSLRQLGAAAPERVREMSASGRLRDIIAITLIVLILAGFGAYAAFGNQGGTAKTSTPPAVTASGDADIAILDSNSDENGANDKLIIHTTVLPTLAKGHQFAAWVVDSANERITPLGVLTQDDEHAWGLTYNADGKEHTLGSLLNTNYTFQITDETAVGALPGGPVVAEAKFATTESFSHIQHLLTSFPNTPNHVGIIIGMAKQIHTLLDQVEAIKTYQQRNFPISVQCEAQSVVDILEGAHGANYKPLSDDCIVRNITQMGDGNGLLGDSGYLKEGADHAQFAAQAKDATTITQEHAGHVIIACQNIEGWLATVDQDAVQIARTGDTAKLNEMITLTQRAISGQDVDGNETIDPIKNEAGLNIAYAHAQKLAGLTLTLVTR